MNLGTLWFGSDIDLTQLRQKIQNGNQSILDALKMNYDPASYQQMVNKLRTELGKETFDIKISANTQGLAQNIRQQLSGNSGLSGGLDALNEKIKNQTIAVNALKTRLEQLKMTYAKYLNHPSYDSTEMRNRISSTTTELMREKQTLADMVAQRNALRNSTQDTILNLRREAAEQRNAAKAAKESTIQRQQAVRQLTSDHVRLNSTIAGGIHVSTQLGSALSSIFAIDAARQFLHSVIEIGGQLEKQRISIGAILGDTVKANHLFEQIKGLALKSPFGVVELDQYTKQLSAYGFRYNELFDMTKRLADISAGAGQDIGRLTLALGHVRSATYLTGITLRQFSMNNIPMLKMLSEYYTEVEKKAVSTAEVQKRISKRQVSYEDVIEQIRRLTDEGGMFYNMQEKISESLAARFKNLKDAMDIMYGEMAEGFVGDWLKDLASALLKVTRHWKEIGAVMGVAAAMFTLGKLRIGAYTLAVQANTAASVKQIMADKQLIAARTRQIAITRTLTAQEQAQIITSNQLRAMDLKQALASGVLSKEEALRLVTLKKIKIAQAMHLVGVQGITKAEIQAAIAAKRWRVALAGMRTSLINAFSGVGIGTWATLAAMAGTEIYMAYSSWVDRIDDKSNEMKDLIKSRINDLEKMQRDINADGKPNDKTALKARVGEMKQVLANSEAYTKTLDEQLSKAGDLPKQYDILADAIDNAAEKNRRMLDYQDRIADMIKASSVYAGDSVWEKAGQGMRYFFNDDISQNMSQALDAYKNLRLVIDGAWEYRDAIKAVIEEMIASGEISEQFAEKLRNAPFEEQIQLLAESGYWQQIKDKVTGLRPDFLNFADKIIEASNGVTERWDEIANDDIPRMLKREAQRRKISEEALNKWCIENIDDFKMMLDGIADQLDIKEPAIRKRLKRLFYDYVRFSGISAGLAEGAVIGASVFGDEYLKKLLDDDEKADIKDNTKGDSGKSSGNKKDKDLEAAKTKLQEYKAFLSEYKKYREIYNKEKAIDLLETLFPNLKGQGANLVDNYTDMLTKLRNSLAATTEARKKFINEVDKTGADTLFDRDKEKLKEYADATDDYIKRTEEQWKNYRSLMKKSGGNRDIAQMAFGDGAIWDETAKKMLEEFNRLGNERGVALAYFSWDMNEKELKETLVDAKGVIQGDLVKLAQEIQKVIRGNYKQFADDTAEAYGKSLSAAEKLLELEQKRRDLIKNRDTDNDQSGAQKGYWNTQIAALDKQIAEQKWEAFKETEQWGRIFANLDNISTSTLEDMLRKLQELVPQLNLSAESTKAIYEAMDRMKGTLAGRNPFAFLSNSLKDAGILKGYIKQAKSKGDLVANTELSRILGVKVGSKVTLNQLQDKLKELSGNIPTGLNELTKKFKALQEVLQPVIDLFDQLGMTELSDIFSMGNNALGAAASVASGLDALGLEGAGPYGAAIGAGLSIVSSLFAFHDAALQEEIEASQARQKEMESLTKNLERVLERTLGGFYNVSLDEFDRSQLSTRIDELGFQASLAEMLNKWIGTNTDTKGLRDEIKLLREALKTNDNYKAQKASLMAQRAEIERQMQLEQDKKSSDESAIQGYKDSLQEIDDQIKHFAEDMAKAIYDIDIKSWAQELGDALFEAWQKGESGAEAFKKKAREIITDVAKNIAVRKLIETALKPVLDIITSEMDRKSGKLDTESIQLLANAMEAVGTTLPDSFNSLMEGIDAGLQKAGLGSMKDDAESDTSNSITSGIKSITENTADLLASYINAMRGDLSLQRTDVYAIRLSLEAMASRQNVIAEAQTEQMRQIAANTYRNADAADAILLILRRATQDKAFGIHVQ